MFSPDSTVHSVHGTGSRNPRRRPRNDSDSVRQQTQRKRSKLSEETFTPPTGGRVNGNGSLGMNGHVRNGHHGIAPRTMEVPLREKKPSNAAKRTSKGDGSITLTKTDHYAVKRLPSFPNYLRENPAEPFRAFSHPSSPYALALTHKHAFIWDYTSSQAATPRTVALPHMLKQSDSIPLGSLVNTGLSSEIGMVVVYPRTGKIVFWENVDGAESQTIFRQRRQGVEGSVGGMLSGEHVVDLIDAGVAGFVLTFSTGRMAQLTLQDGQGRPSISVTLIRTGNGGGLLSGLRNVFSGSSQRREIAAVRTRKSHIKGETEVVTATRAGRFQLWSLGSSGQQKQIAEASVHEDLLAVLQDTIDPELRGHHTEISILDFALISEAKPSSSRRELAVQSATSTQELSILAVVVVQGPVQRSYTLVELALDISTPLQSFPVPTSLQRLIPLYNYEEENISDDVPTAKLLLPAPGKTAYIIFSKAIAVVSLVQKQESAEDQLLADSGAPPPRPFQDALYLLKNTRVTFVGASEEDPPRKDGSSKIIIFASGCGVLRLTSSDTSKNSNADSDRITAKSKIEQAVFFGPVPGAIFDFTPKSKQSFPIEEVERAALAISQEIVSSSSDYIPQMLPSMEQHLNLRIQAMDGLAEHLRKQYPPLSRKTKWTLLWNAEKAAAAWALWKLYENRNRDSQIKVKPLLSEMVDLLNERYKTELRPTLGENDPVRQWFVRDVDKIQNLLPWALRTVQLVYKEGIKDQLAVVRLVSEADDIVVKALQSAFMFREEQAAAYGLADEPLKDGVLQSGYGELPGPWTSTHNVVDSTRQLVDVARRIAEQNFEESSGEFESILKKIAIDNPELVSVSCQTHIERYLWCEEQDDTKTKVSGQNLRQEFLHRIRPKQLGKLAEVGQVEAGMRLAEKYRDMATLVDLVGNEYTFLEITRLDDPIPALKIQINERLKVMNKRIQVYFDNFKEEWANAWYNWHIRHGRAAAMFDDRYSSQKLLTKYLRSDPSRAKLSWINDIINEKDFVSASLSLNQASSQESNVWCKKMEASIAKLALMAAGENNDSLDASQVEESQFQTQLSLQVIDIQEKTYEFLRDEVLSALDYESALDVCMEKLGKHYTADRPALRSILRQGLEQLIYHRVVTAELLIDVLTLINDDPDDEGSIIRKTQFGMALSVLEYQWTQLDPIQRDGTLRLIWKRCLLRDEWEAINNTADRSDADVKDMLKETTLFYALKASAKRTDKWSLPSTTPPIPPSSTLNALCTAAELTGRFPAEDLRDPINHDNIGDDDIVQKLIEANRLDHWFETAKQLVIETIDEEDRAEQEGMEKITRTAAGFTERGRSIETDEEEEETEGSNGSRGSGGFEGDDESGLVDAGDGEGMDMDE